MKKKDRSIRNGRKDAKKAQPVPAENAAQTKDAAGASASNISAMPVRDPKGLSPERTAKKVNGTVSSSAKRQMARTMEKKRRRRTTIGVSAMVVVLVAILSVQTVRMNDKNAVYEAQEEELEEELAAEEQRTEALQDEEEYVNSDEYKESVARSRLGMAYDDEIIFREK